MNWSEEIKKLEGLSFGDSPEMADDLLMLDLEGKKTATSSLLISYKEDNEPLPRVGDKSYSKNFKGEARCVVELTDLVIKPFKDVEVSLAIAEGEGDLSLKYWQEGHANFFSKYCDFNEDLDVVSEYFKVLHRF